MAIAVLPSGIEARLGGHLVSGGATFRIWAPAAREVYLLWGDRSRRQRPDSEWRLAREGEFFIGFMPGARDGDRYRYWVVGPGGEGPKRDPHARELEWDDYPDSDAILRDPASYPWASDAYRRKPPQELVLYQLHVGTFWFCDANGNDLRSSRIARFLDILGRFADILALNISGIQLLPIVEWRSIRSMGYNGTDIYSPEMDHFVRPDELSPYLQRLNELRQAKGAPPLARAVLESGVNQLKALIDLLHLHDIAVFFDVVYNHLGGSFDAQSIECLDFHVTEAKPYGPYFQRADWAGGHVPDFSMAPVRRFLIENAQAMAAEYRIDGIRYDEVTVIDAHGGWGFCKELTSALAATAPDMLNVAEFWQGDKRVILEGGAGFDAVWLDTVRDAVRSAIAAAARGRSAWVDMTRVAAALSPTFGESDAMSWRAVHCIDNHDLSLAAKPDKVPRIARLADQSNSRSWYGRSRSRVANALLLSSPGIPMLFMGQEILEDKFWTDDPPQFPGALIWWQGVKHQREMSEHLRFMQDFIRVRRERPALRGRTWRAYQVHDLDRILVLLRGNGNPEDDIVIVFSLNENTLHDYEIGFPHGGTWHLLLSGDSYEIDGQRAVITNDTVDASGPGRHTMPASARVTVPANGVLVFGRSPTHQSDEEPVPPLHLRFQRPSDWAESVHIHYWDTRPVRRATQWPGVPLRHLADDWYEIELEGVSATSIVFNDGRGRQTADLRRESDGWYLTAGIWSDEDPRPRPKIDAAPRQQVYSTAVTVHLSSSSPEDEVYYTTDRETKLEDFKRYSTPIELPLPATKQETVVYAYGVRRDGVRGEVYGFKYVIDPDIDLRAPTVTAVPAAGRYARPLDVVFTVSDDRVAPVTAYVTTDGTPATTASPVYVAGVAVTGRAGPPVRISGTTVVSFLLVDGAGNRTSTSFLYTVGAETDFREETIYFLLTTRFYDGDSSRNFFCRDRIRRDENDRPIDPHWRGNFAGLIQRLDYIKDLGFTAIWITPPVENRSGLDYHGYHTYDWTRVDPRLESPGATYEDLIREVHARGMKLVQDVVVNHSCNYGIRGQVWIDRLPIKYYVPAGQLQGQIHNGPYQGNLGNYVSPFREDNDNPVAPVWFRERQQRDPEGKEPLEDPLTGVTLPSPGYRPDRFFNVDTERLDFTWYHHHGFITGGGWEEPGAVTQGHLANDCVDLNTEHEVVKRYLIDAINRYLDLGVDALRLDTLKHMTRSNILEYVNAWKARRPGLFVFGENLVKGTGFGDLGGDNAPSTIRPWWYTRLGDDPQDPNSGPDSGLSVLDFSLFSTFRNNLSQGNFSGLREVLDRDWIYGDATKLVTFLQNHDVGPDNDFRYRFKGTQWMAAAAYNLLWTIRGIPCLYYGEEIEFKKGFPQDIIGNNDTLEDTGRAYFGGHLEGPELEKTRQHPIFRHIQRLNLIRRAIPALQKAPLSHLEEWGSGIRFVRDYSDGQSYAVVGLAVGRDHQIDVPGVRNGTYRDAVTGREVTVTNGTLSFFVRGSSAGIYVKDGPGKIGEDGVYLR